MSQFNPAVDSCAHPRPGHHSIVPDHSWKPWWLSTPRVDNHQEIRGSARFGEADVAGHAQFADGLDPAEPGDAA